MSKENVQESAEDALTSDEITGTADAGHGSVVPASKRNAFAELMSPPKKHKPTSEPPKKAPSLKSFIGRDGLGAYTASPTSFGREVIYHNESFVAINDVYPKSSVHALLLPRDPTKALLHPFDAFEDDAFLASVQQEAKTLKRMLASELRRRYGRESALEGSRREAMDADPPPKKLPDGRDWEKEVMVGVHAGPSMNHLHVHVISVDRFSECLKHRKHYNSFSTPFLVRLDEFPLARDDIRRRSDRGGFLRADFICWRCGENYGNRFTQLKAHLNDEFEAWKKE